MEKLKVWYDKKIVAKWYSSVALWIGISAGLLQIAPEWIQSVLDNWGIASGAFAMSDATKGHIQAFLLFVALPAAKAWRQQNMSKAALQQAVNRGEAIPVEDDGSITLRKDTTINVPGTEGITVRGGLVGPGVSNAPGADPGPSTQPPGPT